MFRVFDKRDSSGEESAYGPGIVPPPLGLAASVGLVHPPLLSLFSIDHMAKTGAHDDRHVSS